MSAFLGIGLVNRPLPFLTRMGTERRQVIGICMNQTKSMLVDPILDHVGFICIVKLSEKSFSARLIDVRGDGDQAELWFENRGGLRFMIQRRDVIQLWRARIQPPREGGGLNVHRH